MVVHLGCIVQAGPGGSHNQTLATIRPMSETNVQRRPLRVAMVLEQHLGHGTFASNLRTEMDARPDVEPMWIPISYSARPTPFADHRWRGALAGRRTVRAALRTHRPDVWLYNTQVPAALAGQRLLRPYVVVTDVTPLQYDRMADLYGHRTDRIDAISNWKHRVNTRVFREAAWCVPWSNWVAESLRDDYAVAADRIRVIPPGVDSETWRTERDDHGDAPFRVLFVGGDFRRKGGDVLLEAFKALPQDAELHLVTHAEVPSSDRVHIINDLGPNDPRLVELFHRADVFALPSMAETFGIAAVEASAAGLPVVASSIGGLGGIVEDGSTGYAVPPGDVEALGAALLRLYDDRALCRRLGAAGRHLAETEFDVARNTERLVQLLHSCVRAG